MATVLIHWRVVNQHEAILDLDTDADLQTARMLLGSRYAEADADEVREGLEDLEGFPPYDAAATLVEWSTPQTWTDTETADVEIEYVEVES